MHDSLEIYNEIAYIYDGTTEGLFSAIFESYAKRETPSDIFPEGAMQARLGQYAKRVETNIDHAIRVKDGIREKLGNRALRFVSKASLSSDTQAPFATYRFISHAFEQLKNKDCSACRRRSGCKSKQERFYCPKVKAGCLDDITHPNVEMLFKVNRSFNNECEKIRQFARFEYVEFDGSAFYFAKINPKDSVIPFVMEHFVERFNIQPFIIYDEIHKLSGIYDIKGWYLSKGFDENLIRLFQSNNKQEIGIQDAWRRFYRVLSIDERYNPELRRQMMPMRFWKNICELKDDRESLYI